MLRKRVAVVAMSCLAACSDRALLQDEGGCYRVVADGAFAALAGPLARGEVDAVVVLDGDGSRLRTEPAWPKGQRTPLVVGIGEPADTATDPDALVVAATGADVAIDLALLTMNGIAIPPRLPIGTTLVTAPNRAAGGQREPAPGDAIVALLRRQYAAVLTTQPATDEIHHIALVCWRDDDPWQQRVRADATAAAKRYPQVELHVRCADGDAERQREAAKLLADEGARAVLVSVPTPASLAPLAADLRPRNVALIVLGAASGCDQATCCVGTEPAMLGRAAALGVRALLPERAALALTYTTADPDIAARERGFVDALALRRR